MVTPRPLSWIADDDGSLVALNPYPGAPESSDYASRYIVRGDETRGFTTSGEYQDGEATIGSFGDVEDARAAAQSDADQASGVDADIDGT